MRGCRSGATRCARALPRRDRDAGEERTPAPHPSRRLRRRPRSGERPRAHDRRPPRRRTERGALASDRRLPLEAPPLDAAVRRGHHHGRKTPQPPRPARPPHGDPRDHDESRPLNHDTPADHRPTSRPRRRPRPRRGPGAAPHPPLRRRPRRADAQRSGGLLPPRARARRTPEAGREPRCAGTHGGLPLSLAAPSTTLRRAPDIGFACQASLLVPRARLRRRYISRATGWSVSRGGRSNTTRSRSPCGSRRCWPALGNDAPGSGLSRKGVETAPTACTGHPPHRAGDPPGRGVGRQNARDSGVRRARVSS